MYSLVLGVSAVSPYLYSLLSLQNVPLAGIVRCFGGVGAVVPALPQRGSTGFCPEEADAGSPGWGNWRVC